MKRKIVLWCVVCLAWILPVKADLISLYDFEEPNPYDDKITGAVAAVGANVTIVSDMPLGDALLYPDGTGTDNYLVVAQDEAPVIGLSDFTGMAWVRRTEETSAADGICDMVTGTTTGGFQMLLVGDFRLGVGGPANQWILFRSVQQMQDTDWHHVAVSVDRDNPAGVSMYIDGVLDSTADPTGFAAVSMAANQDYQVGAMNGASLHGILDELAVFDTALTVDEIQQAMKGVGSVPELASAPAPEDAVADVPRNVVLSWAPGEFAAKHDVYLGTNLADVNEADRDNPQDVLLSQGQSDTSFDVGVLAFGQTYYWRVDEVNSPPDNTVFKGNIWSFQVEPIAYPIENIQATASSAHDQEMIPEKTIDGSGLDEQDQHNSQATDMWLSGMGDPTPSIQYTFDRAYKLHEMWVWNSNQAIESFVGLGAKDVTIEISENGTDWTVLEGVPAFAQAPGQVGYAHNTTVDFGGAMAQHVKLSIQAGHGILPQSGLSEVRFFYIPTFAREPMPLDQGSSDGIEVELAWRAGREAVTHDVYLGSAPENLSLVGNPTTASFLAAGLDYDQSYYWQVIEINEAADPTTHAGAVWSFSTPAYALVDSFEDYDDECKRIFFAWQDGLGHNGSEGVDNCNVPPYNGNGTGSAAGHGNSPFAEQTLVKSGGQSMPLFFDGPSEVTLALAGEDWSAGGSKTLSLAFHGAAGNTGQLYIKINNAKIEYDGAAGDIALAIWQTWNVDLNAVAGAANVTSLTIGVDGAGAAGVIYIDDIRLYPKQAEVITPTDPGTENLVLAWNLDEGNGSVAADSSGNGNDGTLVDATWGAGKSGSALVFDTTLGYVESAYPGVTGTASRSCCAWIKTAATSADIMSFGQNVAGKKWRMWVYGSGVLRIEVNGGFHYGQANLADDEWHHVAVVLDSDGAPDVIDTQLYVDGLADTTGSSGSEPIDTDSAGVVRIGLAPYHTTGFVGLIDDARIYDRALSAAEVAALVGKTEPIHKPF